MGSTTSKDGVPACTSKMQNFDQLKKFQCFHKQTKVGGSIMAKYEPENMKEEIFLDPRWHQELNVRVDEDLWVLQE